MRGSAGFSVAVWLAFSAAAQAAEPDLKNGEYMYYAGGCGSCHAAPASDKCDDRASGDILKPVGGRCLKTEFGTFNVPNITPDNETGIGGWSEEDFIRAMREGTAPDGSNLYPAFPYSSYQRMKLEDIRDLWAFLKSLPAVTSNVPDHDLSFPYSIRSGLSVWKGLYLDGKTFEPDPSKPEKINRGAYLVQGPGHCGECHTPRDSLGGKLEKKALSGAPEAEGSGYIPNITPHKTGIGSWTEKDIVYALESGFTPSGDVMGGSMAAVQRNMAKLTKADLEAIAAYLRSVAPIENEAPKKK
jgi:mono/diheme cytochrome c family protein